MTMLFDCPEDCEALIVRVAEIMRGSRAMVLGAIDHKEQLTVCSMGIDLLNIPTALRTMADHLDGKMRAKRTEDVQ